MVVAKTPVKCVSPVTAVATSGVQHSCDVQRSCDVAPSQNDRIDMPNKTESKVLRKLKFLSSARPGQQKGLMASISIDILDIGKQRRMHRSIMVLVHMLCDIAGSRRLRLRTLRLCRGARKRCK
jgi:hypothetical protein